MKSLFAHIFTALASLMLLTVSASGDIVVTFLPSNPSPLIAGSSGQIDVLIASSSLNSDLLDQFLVDVVLTPLTGPAGGLRFSAIQSELFVADPDYIFYNRSQSSFLGAPVGTVDPVGDIYSAYDATDDGGGPPPAPGMPFPVFVPTIGNEALLFRLDLDALAAGTYEIDLHPLSQFADDNGFDISFTSTPGFLTVNAAHAAVPEPSSVLLLSLGTIAGAIQYRRRKRGDRKQG